MRFNHITLAVTDLERSKAFYRTLGLVQIVDEPPRYARFVFPEGDATLSVEVTGDRLEPSLPCATLFFECAALDQTVAALEARGLVFEQAPVDMFYLWREARLRDPDGHALRLYCAGDNRLNPPWKIRDPAATD
jgi:catechol 2,3-dioxygenase-like lactoylglutathione lyase family enzyme